MVQFFQWWNARQVSFIFYIGSILADFYQRHWQPCCTTEFGKLFLQPKLRKKKRHILGALGEEDLCKYKGKMQEFLLCCCFGFFFPKQDIPNPFRHGVVSSTGSSPTSCPALSQYVIRLSLNLSEEGGH